MRDPHLLAVWLNEDKVAAQIRDGQRAGEVRVGDWAERQRAVVVDVAGAAASDEKLDAVVGHRHRAVVGDRAKQHGVVRRVHAVEFVARHDVGVAAVGM